MKRCDNSLLYTDKHFKGLYGSISILISDNSLFSEIVSISNLGSASSNWNSHNVKDYDKKYSDIY